MRTTERSHRPTIGVLTGWVAQAGGDHTFYNPLLRGIQTAAAERNCNLLLTCGIWYSVTRDSRSSPDWQAWPRLSPLTDFVPVGPWNTDGLIVFLPLASQLDAEYIQMLIQQGHPIVFIGSGEHGARVCIDNEAGIRQMIDHLVAHGHRHIAFIFGEETRPGDGYQRLTAYKRIMQEYNLPLDPALIVNGDHFKLGGARAMQELLHSGSKFTAVMASNDESACGAMHVLRQAGLRIPEDVAVIGFDDRLEALAEVPPLTSIRYPLFDTGAQAFDLLLKHLSGATDLNTISMPTKLIIRDSCGCSLPGPSLVIPEQEVQSTEQRKTVAEVTRLLSETVLLNIRQLGSKVVYDLSSRLAKAFVESVEASHPAQFLQTVKDLLAQTSALDDEPYILQEAILALQQEICSLSDKTAFQAVLDQALLLITKDGQYRQSRRLAHQSYINNEIGQLSVRLHAALDEEQMFVSLAEALPQLAIQHAHIAFFEAEGDDPVAWSILRSLPDALYLEQRFPTRSFPPPALYSSDDCFHLVVLPLIVQGQPLGYVAMDADKLHLAPLIVLELAVALKTQRLYAQAQEARRSAEEANRLKTRFLSTVSHELQTPLSQIVGLSELLLKQAQQNHSVPLPHQTDIERIYVNAQHLGSLIRDVLDLSSSEAGQLRLTFEPLYPKDIFDGVLQVGEQLARDKGLAWQCLIADDLAPIWADRTRLRQVALNLLTNAIKFTTRGCISFEVEADQDQFRMLVRDTGLGIPLSEQTAIFDAFRQSDRTTSRRYGGLGLGLAICKQLVELHQGEITVQSSGLEGHGSTFLVTLPVLKQLSPLPALPQKTSVPPSLLLLASHKERAQVLQERLVQEGYLVEGPIVVDETEVIPSLVAPYDAVLLDAQLASEQGWEIAKMLKEHPQTQDTPVLFYSLPTHEYAPSLFHVDYLMKPVGTADLAHAFMKQGLLVNGHNEPRTILIVDDDPAILDMHARMVLSHVGSYQILKAGSGQEALAIIKHHHVDLILLDLMMPDPDGFAVLNTMRTMQEARTIPVIVLTAHTLTEADITRLNRGVTAILQKGVFSIEETLAHIEKALARAQKLGTETQRLVRTAMAYIHTHYASLFSREELANHVHVNADYLTRCFHQEVGVSPMNYVNRYRVNQAKKLLITGTMSISDIALAVGFSDTNHFGRAFRREVGVSPTAYQRQHISV